MSMRWNVRRWVLMGACAGVLAGAVHAANAPTPANQTSATDAAHAAFFSMDAAHIEGSYSEIAPPQDFTPGEEADLLVFLQAQKARGADVNAYRHLAPMLHHAVRAGMNETVDWLLRHGAKPLLSIQVGDNTLASPPIDAVAVAITVGNWVAFERLMKHPDTKALTPSQRAQRYWPVASKSATATQALLARRFGLPRFADVPPIAADMLLDNLCLGQTKLAMSMLTAEPDAQPYNMLPPYTTNVAAVCQDSRYAAPTEPETAVGTAATAAAKVAPAKPAASPAHMKAQAAQWRALQERLHMPMAPFALRQMRDAASMQALHDAGVRVNWSDTAEAKRMVLTLLLQADQQPWLRAWLRQQPADALRAVLVDMPVFREWMRHIPSWPLEEMRWALEHIQPSYLGAVDTAKSTDQPLADARASSQLVLVMDLWSYAASTRREATDAPARLARWEALTQRLPVQPVATPVSGLVYRLPLPLWPQWFARGYRIPPEDWVAWFERSAVDDFEKVWPLLQKYQPEVTRHLLEWMVAPLSVGPTEDAVARVLGQRRYYSGGTPKAVQFLYGKGLRVSNPRWLAAQFAVPDERSGLAFELQHGLVKEPPPQLRHQLQVSDQLACTPSISPALRRSLAQMRLIGEGESNQVGDFDLLQPLAQPGNPQCLWIGAGGDWPGRKLIDDEDFFSGVNRLTPCADGQRTASVWDERLEKWVALPDGQAPTAGWAAVSLRGGKGSQAVATYPVSQGGCGTSPSALYEVHAAPVELTKVITPLSPDSPLSQAFELQCSGQNELETCLDPAPSAVAAVASPSSDTANAASQTAIAFIADRYLDAQKQAFLKAIADLNKDELARAEREGIFVHWGVQAFAQVSASSLPVPDKRRRTAWLLARPQWVAALDGDTLLGLAKWLPPEDWTPIVRTMRCSSQLQYLREKLGDQIQPALQRRLGAAPSQPCR